MTVSSPPLKVWITRARSADVYLNGTQSLSVWLSKPTYSHTTRGDQHGSVLRFIDLGWNNNTASVGAKDLIDQDTRLHDLVWDEVVASCAPAGMSHSKAQTFPVTGCTEATPGDPPVWSDLFHDNLWEAKCNTSFKRFLLEVDLRSNSVCRIVPSVQVRNEQVSQVGLVSANNYLRTDTINEAMALEHLHPLLSGTPF